MTRDSVKADIEEIVTNTGLSVEEQIKALESMYQEVRAEQRAATESAMVDDNDLGAELQQIKLALERLNAEPESPEDKSAATL